jgi:hypothetical protein
MVYDFGENSHLSLILMFSTKNYFLQLTPVLVFTQPLRLTNYLTYYYNDVDFVINFTDEFKGCPVHPPPTELT